MVLFGDRAFRRPTASGDEVNVGRLSALWDCVPRVCSGGGGCAGGGVVPPGAVPGGRVCVGGVRGEAGRQVVGVFEGEKNITIANK